MKNDIVRGSLADMRLAARRSTIRGKGRKGGAAAIIEFFNAKAAPNFIASPGAISTGHQTRAGGVGNADPFV